MLNRNINKINECTVFLVGLHGINLCKALALHVTACHTFCSFTFQKNGYLLIALQTLKQHLYLY